MKREKSNDIRIDNVFKVGLFDATSSDWFRVHVRNDEIGLEFRATVSTGSVTEDKNLLLSYIRERAPVKLRIKAKKIRDEIRNTVIVGISDPEDRGYLGLAAD